MRLVRLILVAGGAAGIVFLAYNLGAESIASAVSKLSGWQFALICCIYGVNLAIDTVGWQYTLLEDRGSFRTLLAARCASEASNALTVLASVGGEAIKAWLVRLAIPYDESIPSLILAKTAEVLGQTLLLGLGILVGITSGLVTGSLSITMSYLLVAQVVAVGGFILVQFAGVIGKAGRVLSWARIGAPAQVQQVGRAVQGFYRHQPRRFLLSTALHFAGALIAVLEAFVILSSFQPVPSLTTATIIEALWSGVRFVTFFVPGSLGSLEGANAAAFPALGLAASAGLAFTLIRRARQIVWIVVGLVVLVAMRSRSAVLPDALIAQPLAHRARRSSHLADSRGA